MQRYSDDLFVQYKTDAVRAGRSPRKRIVCTIQMPQGLDSGSSHLRPILSVTYGSDVVSYAVSRDGSYAFDVGLELCQEIKNGSMAVSYKFENEKPVGIKLDHEKTRGPVNLGFA